MMYQTNTSYWLVFGDCYFLCSILLFWFWEFGLFP